ncbi:MAG: hypothetical protein ACI8XZ_005328 [Gammaproteobacteria bacterium]|jgi:hypothetical protein
MLTQNSERPLLRPINALLNSIQANGSARVNWSRPKCNTIEVVSAGLANSKRSVADNNTLSPTFSHVVRPPLYRSSQPLRMWININAPPVGDRVPASAAWITCCLSLAEIIKASVSPSVVRLKRPVNSLLLWLSTWRPMNFSRRSSFQYSNEERPGAFAVDHRSIRIFIGASGLR